MSRSLLEHALINSLLALVMAIVTVAVGRWVRNSRVDRTLCLGILLKLVTPAFLLVPVLTPEQFVRDAPTHPLPVRDTRKRTIENDIEKSRESRAPEADQTLESDRPSHQSPLATAQLSPPLSESAITSEQQPKQDAGDSSAFRTIIFMIQNLSLPSWLVLCWLTVSVGSLALVLVRALKLQRFLTTHPEHEAPTKLRESFHAFIQELTPGRSPHLKVINGPFSPFTWTWFRRTTIVIPARLLDELTFEQQEMIMVHELAHIRRHDHQLRWFETCVQSLYWWLPLVPWVRGRLHLAQEYCCDAEVARRFPLQRDAYMEALYRTANWVANEKRPPGLAVEFLRTSTLKTRIQNLLQPQSSDRLSLPGQFCSLLSVALFLMISIQFVIAENPQLPPATPSDQQEFSIELSINDAAGKPVSEGTVLISGEDDRKKFFKTSIKIEKGVAQFVLKARQMNYVEWKVESPGFMTHLRKFEPGPKLAYLTLNSRYAIQLKEAITIGGTVVDAAGKPVANARVHASTSAPQVIERSETIFEEKANLFDGRTSTNERGEWTLAGADPDLPHFHLYIAESHESDPGQSQVVRPEDFEGLKNKTDVRTLAATIDRSVRVTDESGNPIAGVMLLTHRQNLYIDYGEKRILITNENGELVVKGLKDQVTNATLFSPDWGLTTVKIEHQVAAPMNVIMRKGKRIEFKIVDEAEQPVAGIALYPEPTDPFAAIAGQGYEHVLDFLGHRRLIPNISDAEGRIVWENAPNDILAYQMASAKILNHPRSQYAPSETPHRIVVRRAIPVTIAIIDDVTGQGIVDYRIFDGTHFKSNPPAMWEWSQERPQKDWKPGRYETKLLSLDRMVQYRIEADGYKFELTEIFDPEQRPNEQITTTVRLKKLSPISGTVLSPDGSPATTATIAYKIVHFEERPGLRIVANQIDMSTATSETTTDNEGRFQLNPPDHHFVCFVSHRTGYAYLSDVDLYRQPEIRLTPWSRIEGRLQIRHQPAKQMTIRLAIDDITASRDKWGLYHRPDYENVTQTDDEGNYHFDYVPAGSVRQHILYDPSIIDYDTAYYRDIRLTVTAGQTMNASLDSFPVSLVGRYRFPEDAHVGKSRSVIYLIRKVDAAETEGQVTPQGFTRDVHHMVFPADGRFEFHQLIPGTYELTARLETGTAPSIKTITKTIEIAPDRFSPELTKIDMGEIQIP